MPPSVIVLEAVPGDSKSHVVLINKGLSGISLYFRSQRCLLANPCSCRLNNLTGDSHSLLQASSETAEKLHLSHTAEEMSTLPFTIMLERRISSCQGDCSGAIGGLRLGDRAQCFLHT